MRAYLSYLIARRIPSSILLGGIDKVSNSNTSVLITPLTHSSSYKVNGGILTLAISNNVRLFTLAVLITRNYAALNTSRLITYIARVLSLLRIVAA